MPHAVSTTIPPSTSQRLFNAKSTRARINREFPAVQGQGY